MATVTVRGAGGTTVTIGFGSTLNAFDAQSRADALDNPVTYLGGDTLPSASLPAFAVIDGSVPSPGVLALPVPYTGVVVSAAQPTAVISNYSADNVVIAGSGGLTYLNASPFAEIYLGGGTNGVAQVAESARAQVFVDGPGALYLDNSVSFTFTEVFTHGDVLTLAKVGDFANARMQVMEGKGVLAVDAGSSNAGGVSADVNVGAELRVLPFGGRSFISASGDVTIFGNVGGGQVTLFGSPLGNRTVVEGRGLFEGSFTGSNLMFSSTVAGAATLVGGASGDRLFSMGAGQVLQAGTGSDTLSGAAAAIDVGGSTFRTASVSGETIVFGNRGGGNRFELDTATSQITGFHGAAPSQATANTYVAVGQTGTHIVGDFISGVDRFDVAGSAGAPGVASLTYFNANDAGSPFGAIGGTELKLSLGVTVWFYDSKVLSSDLVLGVT